MTYLEFESPGALRTWYEHARVVLPYRSIVFVGAEEWREPDYETWASRHPARLMIDLFPLDQREEWLGDLHEISAKLLDDGYSRTRVNITVTLRTVVLVVSALKISASDLLAAAFNRTT